MVIMLPMERLTVEEETSCAVDKFKKLTSH